MAEAPLVFGSRQLLKLLRPLSVRAKDHPLHIDDVVVAEVPDGQAVHDLVDLVFRLAAHHDDYVVLARNLPAGIPGVGQRCAFARRVPSPWY